MVNEILSDRFVPHNHPHALAVEQFFSAYDRLVIQVKKIIALTTFALSPEPERYERIDSENLYNYFWILDDHIEDADGALKEMDRLRMLFIHSYCNCQPEQPST